MSIISDDLYSPPDERPERDLNWLERECIPQSIQFMIDLLPTIRNLTLNWPREKIMTVLDIGTASGAGANLLGTLNKSDFFGVHMRVDAMDISPVFEKYASHNFKAINSYIVGDIFKVDRDRYWDLIICSHTIEHIKQPTVNFFIKELQRRCRHWAILYTPYKEQNLLPQEHYTSFDELSIHPFEPELVQVINSPGWTHPIDEQSSCLLFVLRGASIVDEKLENIQKELIERKADYALASRQLEYLLVRFPNHPGVNYLYALSLHFLKKDHEMALQRYTRALKNGYDEFWVRFNRGSLYKETGNLNRSLEDLRRAVKLNPDHEATRNILNEVQKKKESFSTDQEEEEDLELDEIPLPLDLNRIHTLVSNQKYNEALLQIDILLESYPNSPGLNYHYAFCLHMMQMDPEAALLHYSKALEKGFDEFWVKFHRGNLLFELGRLANAKADLEQALLARPNDHRTERQGIQDLLNSIHSAESN